MKRWKHSVIWLVMASFLLTLTVPMLPAQAMSLSDLSQSTTNNDSGGGRGLLDILLGLLLGNLLGKVLNVSDIPGNLGSPNSSGASGSGTGGGLSGGKDVVGFYAEWWGTDTSSYTSLAKNTDTIKTIAPFWATLGENGEVSDRGGNDHASVVKFAHQNNVTALLLVNNAKQGSSDSPIHNVLANPALRTKAINNLEAYMKQYNLDGINIDFEMLSASDRDNLSTFMKELSARLKPQGYIVSIDVFPKQDETNDVAAAYDYAQLAKYADKIMIMTYDYHGSWSDAGPIADVRWVENSIKYALNFIPKNKLYIGVAGYGYDWSSKGVESLEYGPIMDLVDRFGAQVIWDDPSKTPHFSYTGTDGVTHQVWYENARSLGYKLDLVNKYDLAGAALWKLGEEDPASWQVFKDKFKK